MQLSDIRLDRRVGQKVVRQPAASSWTVSVGHQVSTGAVGWGAVDAGRGVWAGSAGVVLVGGVGEESGRWGVFGGERGWMNGWDEIVLFEVFVDALYWQVAEVDLDSPTRLSAAVHSAACRQRRLTRASLGSSPFLAVLDSTAIDVSILFLFTRDWSPSSLSDATRLLEALTLAGAKYAASSFSLLRAC
jgi:hypothetical protein